MIGQLMEGENGHFIHQLVEELCTREPDGGPCLDYVVNALDGPRISIRNAAEGAPN